MVLVRVIKGWRYVLAGNELGGLQVNREYTFSLSLVISLCLGCFVVDVQAQNLYYRWKDSNNNTIYSDKTPPPGVDYQVVNTTSSATRKVDGGQGTVPVEELFKNSEGTASQTTRVVIEKNPEYCAQARQNLSNLNTYARIRVKGPDGEYRYISEEEKVVQRQQAEQAIEDYCD